MTITSLRKLDLAIAHQQAGRLAEAESVYRSLLAADPADADAWHLLGTLASARGQWAHAVDHIEHAAGAGPCTSGLFRESGRNIATGG